MPSAASKVGSLVAAAGMAAKVVLCNVGLPLMVAIRAVAGKDGKIGGVVMCVVIRGMWGSAKLPDVIPMAADVVVVGL